MPSKINSFNVLPSGEIIQKDKNGKIIKGWPTVTSFFEAYDSTEGGLYSQNPDFDSLLRRMGRIHDAKRSDYASNEDPLGNFRESERFGVPAVLGIMTRASDKWTRLCNLLRPGREAKVEDETREDTLLDLANYCLLAIIALRREREGGS